MPGYVWDDEYEQISMTPPVPRRDNFSPTENFGRLAEVPSLLDGGINWGNTREESTFWSYLCERIQNISSHIYDRRVMMVPLSSRSDSPNCISNNPSLLVTAIEIINSSLSWEATAEGSQFWLWLDGRLHEIINISDSRSRNAVDPNSSVMNMFYPGLDIPPSSRRQAAPPDPRHKLRGKKPSWYVK